jgi:hypothetical protein
MMRKWKLFGLAFGLAVSFGCASAPVPAEHMAASESSLRAAEENGAQDVPTAAFYLQLAREQMDTAQKLLNDGHNQRAKWVLMRAESDAELSVALAKENNTKLAAQQAVDQVHKLQGTY